jgi:thiol-disulfide isomerase/thioredoxin
MPDIYMEEQVERRDDFKKDIIMEIKQAKKDKDGYYILEEGVVMPNFVCETNYEFKQDNKSVENTENDTDYMFNLYKSNKPVFINFWATWCNPCVMELPDLQRLYYKYNQYVDFLMINCGAQKNILLDFIKNKEFTFPVGFDTDNKLSNMFSVRSIPMTLILDKNKIIKNIIIGAVSEEEYEGFIKNIIEI